MSDSPYRRMRGPGLRWLAPFPYYVIDAQLDVYCSEVISFARVESARHELTSGSIEYRLILDDEELGAFIIRAIMVQYSTITLRAADGPDGPIMQRLQRLMKDFITWHEREIAEVLEIEFKGTVARQKRLGPKPLRINEWARQQQAAGATIDEILPEYARQRKMDPTEARELLRKALKRKD